VLGEGHGKRVAEPVHVLSPWARRPVFPSYVADTPEGLVTVESFGILGGAWVFVTVDRHGSVFGGEPRPRVLRKYIKVR